MVSDDDFRDVRTNTHLARDDLGIEDHSQTHQEKKSTAMNSKIIYFRWSALEWRCSH